MRITYIHQHFTTPKGAGGTRSYELAQRMIAAGHQVSVICGTYLGGNSGLSQSFQNGCREGMVDGIHVTEFDLAYSNEHGHLKRVLSFIRFSARTTRKVLALDSDVVFSTSPPVTVAIPAVFARLLTRRTIVSEVRDPWPEAPRAMGAIKNPVALWSMAVMQRALCRAAHHMIALSPGIADVIAGYGLAPSQITLVPNGADLSLFAEKPGPRLLDAREDELVALYAGTHGMANGLDAVLDAAAELKSRNAKNIRIVLCGSGQLKPALQERAQREGLDNVVFMQPVPKNKVGALMQGADLGLQVLMDVEVFYRGTSPNKFFDYLATGLPVLTNYPGWVADLVTENQCGFAVPPGNPKAFADALQAALADKQNLKVQGANALALARREFDRDMLARRLIDSIAKVAAQRLKGKNS